MNETTKPTLIFDYDGTIHNTIGIYEKAVREVYAWLIENHYAKEAPLSTERIAGWLGLNTQEMWDDFQPELAQEMKVKSSEMVQESMRIQIENDEAFWYPGVAEMLTQLKNSGHHMVVLSNCKTSYRDAHWKEFQMEKWFDRFYDCESYGFAPKTEIIKEIQTTFPGKCIVIGDRRKDMECARSNGSPFIGCLYGFCSDGELDAADVLVKDAKEIPAAIESLT